MQTFYAKNAALSIEHLPTTIVVFIAFSSGQRKHFSDLWDEDIMLQRKYLGWNNSYRGQSEFLIIALLKKMRHFLRDTKNVLLISQQSGAKNRIITKTCNVMAMAKPINSLQFIFLNHLSSHEKIFIKVTPAQIWAYQISYCPRSSWAALCIDCDSDWMAATNCCWRLGKLTHFVPSALHPAAARLAGMAAWSWWLTPWWHLLTSNDVTPSVCCVSVVVTDWRWPGLEVTVLVWTLAWQLLMCSAYGATTHAMGNVLKEATEIKILLIVLKSRSFR